MNLHLKFFILLHSFFIHLIVPGTTPSSWGMTRASSELESRSVAVVNKKLDTENIRTVLNTTWMMKNFVDFMGVNTAEDWSCKYNHEFVSNLFNLFPHIVIFNWFFSVVIFLIVCNFVNFWSVQSNLLTRNLKYCKFKINHCILCLVISSSY